MRCLRSLLLLILVPAGTLPACIAQQSAPRTGRVHTADVDLATFSCGPTGSATHVTPVIVINGGPGLSHAYLVRNDVWTSRVAQQRLVVLYDQRGTGESKQLRAGAPQSMEAQIADLEAVRASLHAEKVDLAGDSYGGLLAAAYAAAHPEHVNALILSDAATPGIPLLHPRLEEVFPDVVAQTAQEAAKLAGQPDAAARTAQLEIRAHMRMIFYSQQMYDSFAAGSADFGYNAETGNAVSAAIAKLDLTPQMREFHFPTLVIEGRFDLNVTPDVAWNVAHLVPGAQLEFFEKSGHLPYYEEPDKYVSVVRTFLAAHDPAAHQP